MEGEGLAHILIGRRADEHERLVQRDRLLNASDRGHRLLVRLERNRHTVRGGAPPVGIDGLHRQRRARYSYRRPQREA
ncbi:MAG: hypothetical protein ACRDQZ_11285, partial [Mycobacteriales bacterium]